MDNAKYRKGSREALGVSTKGPTRLITDLCVLEPDQETSEMSVVSLHPGVTHDQLRENCGWDLRFVTVTEETPPPTEEELGVLRELHDRTRRAHGGEDA